VSNATKLAEEKILKTQKVKVFEETGASVTSLSEGEFSDLPIVRASARLIAKHTNNAVQERVLRMRHVISASPVTCVSFQKKEKRKFFFVYGVNKQVHFESNPSKHCLIS
jgi:hypothetical protein